MKFQPAIAAILTFIASVNWKALGAAVATAYATTLATLYASFPSIPPAASKAIALIPAAGVGISFFLNTYKPGTPAALKAATHPGTTVTVTGAAQTTVTH